VESIRKFDGGGVVGSYTKSIPSRELLCAWFIELWVAGGACDLLIKGVGVFSMVL
jgi:hypothetical protein